MYFFFGQELFTVPILPTHPTPIRRNYPVRLHGAKQSFPHTAPIASSREKPAGRLIPRKPAGREKARPFRFARGEIPPCCKGAGSRRKSSAGKLWKECPATRAKLPANSPSVKKKAFRLEWDKEGFEFNSPGDPQGNWGLRPRKEPLDDSSTSNAWGKVPKNAHLVHPDSSIPSVWLYYRLT